MSNPNEKNKMKSLSCMTCGKEIVPLWQCICIGSGASSDGKTETKSKDEKKAEATTSVPSPASDPVISFRTDIHPQMELKRSDHHEKLFDPDVIADLVSKKVISIDNNLELGILRIKCPNTALLTKDERVEFEKFIQAIEKSLHQFVDKFRLSDTNYSIKIKNDENGNIKSLKITMSNPDLYLRYHQFALKNLLPVNLNKQEKQASAAMGYHHEEQRKEKARFHPSPLVTKFERK